MISKIIKFGKARMTLLESSVSFPCKDNNRKYCDDVLVYVDGEINPRVLRILKSQEGKLYLCDLTKGECFNYNIPTLTDEIKDCDMPDKEKTFVLVNKDGKYLTIDSDSGVLKPVSVISDADIFTETILKNNYMSNDLEKITRSPVLEIEVEEIRLLKIKVGGIAKWI